jgi:hypothetical protein
MVNFDRLIEVRDELSTLEDAHRSYFDRIYRLAKEAVNLSESINHSLHGLGIDAPIAKLKRSFDELDSYNKIDRELAIHEAYAYLISDINEIINAINRFVE